MGYPLEVAFVGVPKEDRRVYEERIVRIEAAAEDYERRRATWSA